MTTSTVALCLVENSRKVGALLREFLASSGMEGTRMVEGGLGPEVARACYRVTTRSPRADFVALGRQVLVASMNFVTVTAVGAESGWSPGASHFVLEFEAIRKADALEALLQRAQRDAIIRTIRFVAVEPMTEPRKPPLRELVLRRNLHPGRGAELLWAALTAVEPPGGGQTIHRDIFYKFSA